MIRILIIILATIFASVNSESAPFSSPLPSGPKLKISALIDKELVHPGESFKLYLSVHIEEGWHIYSLQPLDGNEMLATQINIDGNVFGKAEQWEESPTSLIQDDAQAKIVKGHTDTAEFQKTFYAPEDINPGSYSIKGTLLYRACDNKLCTLPQSLPFASRVQVGKIK
jgi:DsbC/DsbD-like thiol-disulfide interchange protein